MYGPSSEGWLSAVVLLRIKVCKVFETEQMGFVLWDLF